MTPYGVSSLDQHCFIWWFVVWSMRIQCRLYGLGMNFNEILIFSSEKIPKMSVKRQSLGTPWHALIGLCHHDSCRCPGAISNHHEDYAISTTLWFFVITGFVSFGQNTPCTIKTRVIWAPCSTPRDPISVKQFLYIVITTYASRNYDLRISLLVLTVIATHASRKHDLLNHNFILQSRNYDLRIS